MSLLLDKRHRAMLREMGVRVWLPTAPVLPAAVPAPGPDRAPDVPAPPLDAMGPVPARPLLPEGIVLERPPGSGARLSPAPVQNQAVPASHAAAAWALGAPTAPYAGAAAATAAGPRWLVLVEAPQAVLARTPFQPFEGDAGKLLDNMLRAMRLHQAGTVHLAPLARLGTAADDASAALGLALPALVASWQPDVVLVMGRLAGQAVLNSGEPFGRLRGQVHTVHGVRTVLTYDATYLLRSPADKARAWDDLCLALGLVTGR